MLLFRRLMILFFLSLPLIFSLSCSDGKNEETAQKQPARQAVPADQAMQKKNTRQQFLTPKTPVFKSISPKESLALLQKRGDVIFLDVRSPQERAYASIDGSTLVNFWDLVRGHISLPHHKAILLVCAVGGRSYAAGQILAKKGYPEVYNLDGGIEQWNKDGLPIVRGNISSGVAVIQ